MDENPADIVELIAAVGRTPAVPTLLKLLCESTGMRFAAVARVTENRLTVCAVEDRVQYRLNPGDELPVEPTLIAPIVLSDGRYFGMLCALDPAPMSINNPRIAALFNHFAALIGSLLDARVAHEREHSELLSERASSELREQFIAILGHDLRNPLQAVLLGADRLQKSITNRSQAEMASRIKTNAQRMSRLIDDVLDFARARLGGGIPIEFTEVTNLESNLNAVVQELQDAQPGRRIISNISVSRTVRCDAGRVQQVASNLIANALAHGDAQSPVRFSAETRPDALILDVWNAGDPIPQENIKKIFEPFWRRSVASGRDGLGLGLHICAHIVRAHDGHIAVTSTREGGTCFRIQLPLGTSVSADRDSARCPPLGIQSLDASRMGAMN